MLRNSRKLKTDNFSTKYSVNQIFTNAEEAMLENYMLKSSKINYSITYYQARIFAYELVML